MIALDADELARFVGDGRKKWPLVELSPETFGRFLAERRAPDRPLSSLRIADLYLACACAQNDERALRYFDESVLTSAEPTLRRMGMTPATIDETKQVLRRRFFVGGEGGAPPSIHEFTGRGDLRTWVRVTAVRAALRVIRRPKGQVDADSSLLRAIASPAGDLELEYLKRRYAPLFDQALREAFAALSVREQNVLRYYYGADLTIDAIGALYRAHRATAARWVRSSVDALVTRTQAEMTARLGANQEEIASIMRLVQSRLEPALRDVLAGAAPPSRPKPPTR